MGKTLRGEWVSTDPTEAVAQTEDKFPGQTLILIHGRSTQPSAAHLLKHWRTALDRGLERDFPNGKDLNNTRVQLVYYGDLLKNLQKDSAANPVTELADRESALKSLVALKNSTQFRRVHYEALPGKSSFKEFRADLGAPLSNALGLGRRRLARVMPELLDYWDNTDGFRDQVIERFAEPLTAALERGDRTMVVAHCLGSVIAYDTFWQLSRVENQALTDQRIDTWITLGSPLADDYIRHRLAGGKAHPESTGSVSYPDLVNNWINVAAEDDYFCHDETMANDFEDMLESRLLSRIDDFHIYNLTEHYGKSNPHGAIGYLVHPRLSLILNDWLTSDPDT
jgi:predicted alpha/beta hydrolase family esterase